jgi:hypothetical protein
VFRGYRFEHPRDETVIVVGGWSYLWAGLFGAFYVWRMGFGKSFLRALAINLLYGVVFAGFFFGTLTVIRSALAWYGLQAVAIPVVIVLQGSTMLRMIRDGYRRRGWLVRQG